MKQQGLHLGGAGARLHAARPVRPETSGVSSGFPGSHKAVAILFYPFAFSGVCTGELTAVRDRLAEFVTFDTEGRRDLLRSALSRCGPSPMPTG